MMIKPGKVSYLRSKYKLVGNASPFNWVLLDFTRLL